MLRLDLPDERSPVEHAGLVGRHVEVERLPQSAGVSGDLPKHRLVHIYDKLDVTTRTAAALFAMENDLLS